MRNLQILLVEVWLVLTRVETVAHVPAALVSEVGAGR